ncbi:spore coat protein [Solibacillus sp. FSL W7-1436]|uniref:spore coat protein n=1 Tax=Solibacillus sp. FSL W7-1436 TaxID=2921705 RepID=UPI0030F857DC
MSNRSNANAANNVEVNQFQDQGLFIRNSHTVDVTQTEVQGLLLVQAALQAAIEAAIIVLGSNENADVQNLQRIAQSLEVTQSESQRVAIIDSDGITVRQTEVQIDAVVQATIQLLGQLALKFG